MIKDMQWFIHSEKVYFWGIAMGQSCLSAVCPYTGLNHKK